MSLLVVNGISKKEGSRFLIQNISFSQKQHQKIALAGATGSGKTTLLKTIAGLIQPTEGEVLMDGQKVLGPNEKLIPGHPQIAYLSQHFELRNHYRVEELLQMSNKLTEAEAKIVYEVCRIDHLLKRWTNELSGGERQRIVLAQQLVSAPKLLLLDEPYSNLDPIHKSLLKKVIDDISAELKITCLLVSHDPMDTVSWADEIIVLQDGKVIQKGEVKDVYYKPVNEYSAALFGNYNVLTPALAKAFSEFGDVEMNRIGSFIRPQQLRLSENAKGVQGQIKKVVFAAGYYEVEVTVLNHSLIVYSFDGDVSLGDKVFLQLNWSK
jgi:ABC-type glutathione transport system ATPase component